MKNVKSYLKLSKAEWRGQNLITYFRARISTKDENVDTRKRFYEILKNLLWVLIETLVGI